MTTVSNTPNLSILWAKWKVSADHRSSYHPLLCHMIDVAAVMKEMWEKVLSSAWKKWVAESMELDLNDAQYWLMFFAGAHDLGKASPGFQTQLNKRSSAAHQLITERLHSAHLPFQGAEWLSHGLVSTKALTNILQEQYRFPKSIARTAAVLVGGHHGIFFSYQDERAAKSASIGEGAWNPMRVRLVQELASAIEWSKDIQVPHALTPSTAMAMAGLISVVDWMGSMDPPFKHKAPDADIVPTINPTEYFFEVLPYAQDIISQLGWRNWTPPTQTKTFDTLFPHILSPRPLQLAAIDLAQQLDGQPALIAIEGPMGEGKTESAIVLADHWIVDPGLGGIYFALPTQATSNSMYFRVERYLSLRFPNAHTPLHLIHRQAILDDNFQESIERWNNLSALPEGIDAHFTPEDPADSEGDVIAAEWFLSKKRALLAPFGVGTVDQVLLSALQIKHGFVRLFAFSNKVLIIDEVHAYDTYMSTLLERALVWLGALNVPVILLSATLPSNRRTDLFAAYAQGAGWSIPVDVEASYPRITTLTAKSMQAINFTTDPERIIDMHISWLPDDFSQLAAHITTLLRDGGCVAVICSTVHRAQICFAALSSIFPNTSDDGEPWVDLFHAQFPFEERAIREERVLRRFGPDATHRPSAAIVVATQVIEQSLDLDFDAMITDIAPMDLLLQRAGRLHRHKRKRPQLMEQPQIFIIAPDMISQYPHFAQGITYVYHSHILLRTWMRLQRQNTSIIHIPADVEPLIEWVYGEQSCPEEATEAIHNYWKHTYQSMQTDLSQEKQEAEWRYIKHPNNETNLAIIYGDPHDEEEPEAHPQVQMVTRLSAPSIEVICLSGTLAEPRISSDGAGIDLQKPVTRSDVLPLLKRSIRITHHDIVTYLLAQKVPPAWRKNTLLCHARPLIFDAAQTCLVGEYCIQLDPKLGLVITKTVIS